ncbi:MAG: gfo/Idh/MocA family oxidoreductase, partial [Verrucomicrobiota bacterium]
NFWEYGNRKNGDFGAHHFDIVQWALQMDDSGPVNYVPAGHNGEPFSYFQYANDLKVFKNSDKKRLSINFYGKDGSVHVGRGGKLETTPENIRATRFKESDTMLEESRSHRANWLDCIRSRKQPICHPEVGHRTATICHLLTVAERSGKPVQWDPAKEELIDATDEQKELTYRKRREGFELPV